MGARGHKKKPFFFARQGLLIFFYFRGLGEICYLFKFELIFKQNVLGTFSVSPFFCSCTMFFFGLSLFLKPMMAGLWANQAVDL